MSIFRPLSADSDDRITYTYAAGRIVSGTIIERSPLPGWRQVNLADIVGEYASNNVPGPSVRARKLASPTATLGALPEMAALWGKGAIHCGWGNFAGLRILRARSAELGVVVGAAVRSCPARAMIRMAANGLGRNIEGTRTEKSEPLVYKMG